MCGIAGVISACNSSDRSYGCALSAMYHRGPDSHGMSRHRFGDYEVNFLHTRLAIIDSRTAANQPFSKKHVTLIFNGEIYNYLELRSELEELGHYFVTHSDTEVLVQAYLEWGEECLKRLEGMWAFALFDAVRGALLISRDRFGEKPLFFMRDGNSLLFASSVDVLGHLTGRRLSPNIEKLRQYMTGGFRFIHKTNDTFFEGVRAFPAAHLAWLENTNEPLPIKYWDLKYKPRKTNRADLIAQVRMLLSGSVERCLRADVPVAFCLSGGVDSSALAAIAKTNSGKSPHCFSVIDRDPRYDERDNIRVMVNHLGCQHTEIFSEHNHFFERMALLSPYHNGPIPTVNYFLHSSLLEEIGRHGFKVSISGTGADEIFSGYYNHYSIWLALMSKLAECDPSIDLDNLIHEWRQGYGSHVRNPILQKPDAFMLDQSRHDYLMENVEYFGSFLKSPAIYSWTETKYCDDALHNRMMNELLQEIVPVILAADDSNAMRFSIENRSPYLDRELVELMYTVPSKFLVKDGLAKSILRDAVDRVVPDGVRLDPRKRGFNASIDSLLDRNDPKVRDRLLSDSPIFNIVDREEFKKLLDSDLTKNSYSKFMFAFVSAKAFLESIEFGRTQASASS